MHTLVATLVIMLITPTAHAADWVEKTLRSMTLEQKIGQLLVPLSGRRRAEQSAQSDQGSIDLSADQLALLRDLARVDKPLVFTLFGSPSLLGALPELPSYILTFDFHPHAERAAVRAITGEIPFRGRLPVSLPGLYGIGHAHRVLPTP